MKSLASRTAAASAALAAAGSALAAGDSGTSSVGEMQVGAGAFFGLLGAVVAMGVVLWLMVKFINRPKK
jgi:hypothetical protein